MGPLCALVYSLAWLYLVIDYSTLTQLAAVSQHLPSSHHQSIERLLRLTSTDPASTIPLYPYRKRATAGVAPYPTNDSSSQPRPSPTLLEVRASAFADDLVAYLRNASQLPRFRAMLEIYESGSGARNSWGEKTQGVRIGRSRDPDEDPLPPAWDPTLVNFSSPTVRTLGTFLGLTPGVAAAWDKKITLRIRQRFEAWKRTRLPSSIYGRSLAIKNSVLAIAWYLASHQAPPENTLDTLMSTWQRDAFSFLDTSLRSLENGTIISPTYSRKTTRNTERVSSTSSPSCAHYTRPRPAPTAHAPLLHLQAPSSFCYQLPLRTPPPRPPAPAVQLRLPPPRPHQPLLAERTRILCNAPHNSPRHR